MRLSLNTLSILANNGDKEADHVRKSWLYMMKHEDPKTKIIFQAWWDSSFDRFDGGLTWDIPEHVKV